MKFGENQGKKTEIRFVNSLLSFQQQYDLEIEIIGKSNIHLVFEFADKLPVPILRTNKYRTAGFEMLCVLISKGMIIVVPIGEHARVRTSLNSFPVSSAKNTKYFLVFNAFSFWMNLTFAVIEVRIDATALLPLNQQFNDKWHRSM